MGFVGNDSCLIARNLLNGLRTCWEVFQYLTSSENKLFGEGDAANSLLEGYSKFDLNGNMVSIFILYGLLDSKYWSPFDLRSIFLFSFLFYFQIFFAVLVVYMNIRVTMK